MKVGMLLEISLQATSKISHQPGDPPVGQINLTLTNISWHFLSPISQTGTFDYFWSLAHF